VKAIDEYEYNLNGINKINEVLAKSNVSSNEYTREDVFSQQLRENFSRTNQVWKSIRNLLLSDKDRATIAAKFGEEKAKAMINSGIIGITAEKVDDAKCLHAHVADHLLRGDNLIGELVLKELKSEMGVEAKGCKGDLFKILYLFFESMNYLSSLKDCWQQCDHRFERKHDSWWYVSRKNKQKLRTQKINRRIMKEREMKSNADNNG
jgi:hypothetical protein